jgi:hypothetical protein
MTRLVKSLLAVAALAIPVTVTVAQSSAHNFLISPGGPIKLVSSAATFSDGFMEVRCKLTLAGTFARGTIAKRAETSMGGLTEGASSECVGGSVFPLIGPSGPLPPPITYQSFTGTLPVITAVNARIPWERLIGIPFWKRCLWSGYIFGSFNISLGEITGYTISSNALTLEIDLEPPACSGTTERDSGTFTLSPRQRITLVA